MNEKKPLLSDAADRATPKVAATAARPRPVPKLGPFEIGHKSAA